MTEFGEEYILAIDQGTTSTRVVLYDQKLNLINICQKNVEQLYPQNGYIEHNPEEIFNDLIYLIKNCIAKASSRLNQEPLAIYQKILAIGITNQRETTVLWDKTTGKAIHNAIVWQDRRTAKYCEKLIKIDNQIENIIYDKTGLIIDPYFSASKINWLLTNYNLHNNNNILFGTIDTYLIWQLTGGKIHATDVTNASRTQIYNIKNLEWDTELLEIFNIPRKVLPQVKDCVADYGTTDEILFGTKIPILGLAGDQQAAAIGQQCFNPKDCKITFGTGCFLIENTGKEIVKSQHKLLSTIAYKINNNISYALEGSIFTAGSAIQWLRDSMKFIKESAETESIASSLKDNNGVYLVPAFSGLGAPYWNPNAKGAIVGLSHDTNSNHIIRATLESVAYQTKDLLSAFNKDYGLPNNIKVDGGMTKNSWFLQFLADIIRQDIYKPQDVESTVKGAGMLAALGAGIYSSLENIPINNNYRTTSPIMDSNISHNLYSGWLRAIGLILN